MAIAKTGIKGKSRAEQSAELVARYRGSLEQLTALRTPDGMLFVNMEDAVNHLVATDEQARLTKLDTFVLDFDAANCAPDSDYFNRDLDEGALTKLNLANWLLANRDQLLELLK